MGANVGVCHAERKKIINSLCNLSHAARGRSINYATRVSKIFNRLNLNAEECLQNNYYKTIFPSTSIRLLTVITDRSSFAGH